ncbi:MAG: S8 family peptidase [Paludibacteraceae bacterium]|nr:S8 family peptidase [Paludibacteraceae bacterium]
MFSQRCYHLSLTDKSGTSGRISQPEAYLSKRAINRRARQNIRIDSTDLPVSEVYLSQLKALGCTIRHVSRWQNAVTIQVPADFDTTAISRLPYIRQMELTRDYSEPDTKRIRARKLHVQTADIAADTATYGLSAQQTGMIGLESLHHAGYTGAGMLIAVLDNGFQGSDKAEAMSHLQEHIVDQNDFAHYPPHDVMTIGEHGTYVLSTMAARAGDMVGTAPDADYALYVTEEDEGENLIEIDNLIAGLERADSIGADVVTISLGYLTFDIAESSYAYEQTDGQTRGSMAATTAARKGMLVCIAAGNDGARPYHLRHICIPADADSILCVGSVDDNGGHSSFSSIGPSYNQRVKPDVCTMGRNAAAIHPFTGQAVRVNGTSFATPIMAGAATCAWQAHPELTAMQLREQIILHASQSARPDSLSGYGIPDMSHFAPAANSALHNLHQAAESVYPNPVTDWLFIDGSHSPAWQLYTMDGRVVRRGREAAIDFRSMPAGVYLLQINNSMHKIIRQ